jgi:4'-phosphopantetheinyl transferase
LNVIQVWYASIQDLGIQKDWLCYLEDIPMEWRDYILKFQQIEDQKRTLVARLMLLKLLEYTKHEKAPVLLYNKWGKPKIEKAPFFNWSHSGDFVALAWHDTTEVGIDIEEKKKLDWNEFSSFFNSDQWKEIEASKIPIKTFFIYWTINEAVIKAIGKGMSMNVKDIGCLENYFISVKNEPSPFSIKQVSIDEQYVCHLACEKQDFNIEVTQFQYN